MYLKPPSTGQSYLGDFTLECGIWRDGHQVPAFTIEA